MIFYLNPIFILFIYYSLFLPFFINMLYVIYPMNFIIFEHSNGLINKIEQ